MNGTTVGDSWRKSLAEWEIPPDILAGADSSPWVFPRDTYTGWEPGTEPVEDPL